MADTKITDEGAITTTTDELAHLRDLSQHGAIESAVAAAKDFLGMEVAYATEMTETEQRFKVLEGDGESFGVEQGTVMAVEQTYCHRVLAGRLPNVMADVRGDDRSASLPVTEAADVGAFVSVPLRLSDGRLYGTLCAASHRAMPELGYRELQFLHVFARMIADQLEREQLDARARKLEAQLTATKALMAAVEARDAYTAEHSREVVELARRVAARLGLEHGQREEVEQVALLHDIGKISIPDATLGKPGPLSEAEWEEMRRHPIYGEQLVAQTPGLEHLAPAMRAEHERWDGGGYPDGLAAEAIPIASRIVLACDAYHAMIGDRPYRKAMSVTAARDELTANSGAQFDPEVVGALVECLDGLDAGGAGTH